MKKKDNYVKLIKDFNIKEMEDMIKESPENTSVYIGCDSQVIKGKSVFVTVVIVHYGTKNGRSKVFYKKQKENRKMSIKERLWKEVELVSILAIFLVEIIGDRYMGVHLDLNSDKKHKSSEIVKEAVGYIKGLGFDVKIKPESFASSFVCDKIVKNKMKLKN